jgi:carboxymethylenebutenolidase
MTSGPASTADTAPQQPVRGEWISVPVGGQPMSAYLARPVAATPHGVVLVGFEMFGLSRYIRAVTDRIASLGYTAVAPDFYHRSGDRIDLPETAEGREQGFRLLAGLDRDEVTADAGAVLHHLGASSGTAAMAGLSLGGHVAYAIAARVPLAALALFYPGWLTQAGTGLSRPEPLLDLTPRIAAHGTPVLFLIGEHDQLYTPAERDQIAQRLDADLPDHEMVVYPDASHGFFCHHRDTYRPEAAADAFTRLTRLLADALPQPT